MIKKTNIPFLLLIAVTFLCVNFSCQKKEIPVNTDKEIISLKIKLGDGTTITSLFTVTVKNDSVIVKLLPEIDRSALIPEFEFKGKSISPASGIVQNFTMPVIYTVTADDGSSKSYVVSVLPQTPVNTLFIGSSDKNFYALDATNGTQKWKYTGTESFAYSKPAYNNSFVYTGSIDAHVYAISSISGSLYWKFKTGEAIESSPTIANGTLYIGSNDDYFYAIDEQKGTLKWKFLTGGNVSSTPLVYQNRVYVASSDAYVYALDTSSGQVSWSFKADQYIGKSSPVISNGVLYIGSNDGNLYAINAQSGSLIWKYEVEGKVSLTQSTPAIAGGSVFMSGWYNFNPRIAGAVYAVNTANGTLKWQALNNTGFSSGPVFYNNKIIIAGDDLNLHCLDANTGAIIWQKPLLANGAAAVIENDKIFIGGGGNGGIYSFDVNTGNQIWKFNTGAGGLMTSQGILVGFGQ